MGGALGQQQLPFLALDTKSIPSGWEKASSDLLMPRLPCPGRSALAGDRCQQETRRVSTGRAGPGVGREGHGPGLSGISPCPAPPGSGKAPCGHPGRASCGQSSLLSPAQGSPGPGHSAFNPGSPAVKHLPAAHQHASAPKILFLQYILPNS